MKYWLMKAEPDSRVVKGKDVKFSVDDFEQIKTTPWEGVRNAEARNLMKEMAIGDKVLFYHSNCKIPGIAGFAEVTKEAYPDYTAWDSSHPYFDARTDPENPKWYMVDVTFTNRALHYVSLPLLRRVAESSELPNDVSYIGEDGLAAIKEMALINRGRLSVQRVEDNAYEVIQLLAGRGGWEDSIPKGRKKSTKKSQKTQIPERNESPVIADGQSDGGENRGRKRKAMDEDRTSEAVPLRRSTRTRR